MTPPWPSSNWWIKTARGEARAGPLVEPSRTGGALIVIADRTGRVRHGERGVNGAAEGEGERLGGLAAAVADDADGDRLDRLAGPDDEAGRRHGVVVDASPGGGGGG